MATLVSAVSLAGRRSCSRLIRLSVNSQKHPWLLGQQQLTTALTLTRSSSNYTRNTGNHASDPISGAVPGVPGLFYLPNYFSSTEHSQLLTSAIQLQERLELASQGRESLTSTAGAAASVPPSHSVSIPQPAYVRSAKHNLPSEERYQALKIQDKTMEAGETGNVLGCEYFGRYGEDGHVLVYFRGNHNIPAFVKGRMIQRMEERVPVVKEVAQKKADRGAATPLTWRMTLNVYHFLDMPTGDKVNTGRSRLSGFPFHQDLPANGAVTMIASLGRGAMLQIVHKDHVPQSQGEEEVAEAEAARSPHVRSIWMDPASLLVLSGEARWDWRHRVLPATDEVASNQSGVGNIGRVSIVLGCQ